MRSFRSSPNLTSAQHGRSQRNDCRSKSSIRNTLSTNGNVVPEDCHILNGTGNSITKDKHEKDTANPNTSNLLARQANASYDSGDEFNEQLYEHSDDCIEHPTAVNNTEKSNQNTSLNSSTLPDINSTNSLTLQCERDEILRYCRECTRRVANWGRLLSFCAISGPIHFSSSQYSILAIAVRTASQNSTKLATYKTIRTTQWAFMRTPLFIKSDTVFVRRNTRRY